MSETSQILPPPLVTVVIPCYNYADVVGRAIKSVQEQTLSNFECFVVDNKSTDNSKEAILEAIKGDARFQYLLCQEQGVSHARNKGVFAGTGVFVTCLDSDDALDPQFLEICVAALENDPSLGIAYTGLFYIRPDGKRGLSTWPGKYDYDDFLRGLNQIPTCNMARREVWERLGGQRARYHVGGAGEEDAEMWLRAGALGFKAAKVTDAGLFIYSWMSGRVSGNKEHKMVDYRAWHPWTKDNRHPFASMARPDKYSHPVRQYDEPSVSVIIPVGPGHETDVINALDSLEAQTIRGWEAIVVWDSPEDSRFIETAFPFVRMNKLMFVVRGFGAGYARNRGVEMARSNLLLFLDADDWLDPQAIEKMLDAYASNNAIIYSDYVGKSFIDKDLRKKFGERVLEYDDKDGYAVVRYNAANYDYDKAVRQPHPEENDYPFHWNLITSLTPKKWHHEIGGFDEKMKSWEDWDYWIRMAKAGKPFVRIPEILVVYRFYTGNRREIGLQSMGDLIQYLRKKYEGIKIMPCRSCGKKIYESTNTTPPANHTMASSLGRTSELKDQDFALIVYNHPNRGSHRVVGPTTGLDYGYRSGGGVDRFLVHRADIASMPDAFTIASDVTQPIEEDLSQADTPPPSPIVVPPANTEDKPESDKAPADRNDQPQQNRAPFDLQLIPGVTPIIAQELNAFGIHSPSDFSEITDEQLLEIKGFGPARVAVVRKFVTDYMNKNAEPA